MSEKNYRIAQLDALPDIACPCGTARRAFTDEPEQAASVHLVEISQHAKAHVHQRQTELYVVLKGTGELELDGERIPVQPLTAVLIKPGCVHRAFGGMTILNIVVPAFDPDDEYLV